MSEKMFRVIGILSVCITTASVVTSMVISRYWERQYYQNRDQKIEVRVTRIELSVDQVEQLIDWLENRQGAVSSPDEILLNSQTDQARLNWVLEQ